MQCGGAWTQYLVPSQGQVGQRASPAIFYHKTSAFATHQNRAGNWYAPEMGLDKGGNIETCPPSCYNDIGMSDFEEVEHTADRALRVRGRDLGELLVNAARGMGSLLVPDLDGISSETERRFDIEAFDSEGLLVEWLSELAYLAEMEMLVFREFDLLRVVPTRLLAVGRGGYVPVLQEHIKAVTYHNLAIVQTDQGLEAVVVFDV